MRSWWVVYAAAGLAAWGLMQMASQCAEPRPVTPPERVAALALSEPASSPYRCPAWLPVGVPPNCSANAPGGDLLQGCEERMEMKCGVHLHHPCPERAAKYCAQWRAAAEARQAARQ